MNCYLGLDLGGTNIKAGVISAQGAVLSRHSLPTPAAKGFEAVAEQIAQAGRQAMAQAGVTVGDVQAVGVGAPGLLDHERGLVLDAPNLPGWRSVPLAARMTAILGRPTYIENDANAAAFGEYWAGAGRESKVRHLVMLTLGTGIGSGIVVEGRVVHGGFGIAGEAGHLMIIPGGRPCGCGQKGCLEAYASANATAKRAVEALQSGAASSLTRVLAEGGVEAVTAHQVFQAALAGDGLALRLVDETAYYLGIACINFSRILDPQMIVFAGGMALAGDFLFERIRAAYRNLNWSLAAAGQVQIVGARLGNDAGMIGAAGIAWSACNDRPISRNQA
ncbi:MAG: ROK family glucokinase [Phycisphaeraceae bacterium]|nr:ROK family glucokinase [Phycisphaeraceae bacterium]